MTLVDPAAFRVGARVQIERYSCTGTLEHVSEAKITRETDTRWYVGRRWIPKGTRTLKPRYLDTSYYVTVIG